MMSFDSIESLDLDEMFGSEPEPLDMVLPGLLRSTIGPMVSPGGVGKSMFASQAALQIATGRDTLGLGDVKRGRVVIFAGEDPKKALHHRLRAMAKQFNFLPSEIADAKTNLVIIPTIGRAINILDDACMNWITQRSEGARLIVFDTLTRYHSLDENKAEDAKQIMAALEALAYKKDAAIIFPHHVSKAAATGGMAELQQSARGSSVFVDNARWSSFLAVMTEEEAKVRGVAPDDRRRFTRWNINKQNYSAPIKDLWLERKKGGVLVPANFADIEEKADKYARSSGKGGRNAVCSFKK